MKTLVSLSVALSLFASAERSRAAIDAAADAEADTAAVDAAAASDAAASADDAASNGPPLACDGALCDTSNGATCGVSRAGRGEGSAFVVAALSLLVVVACRRRVSRSAVVAATLSAVTSASSVAAAAPVAVDVSTQEPPPVERRLVLEWNPLPLPTIGKASANVVFAPVDHHAVILSPFYAATKTAPIYVFDDPANPGTPTAQLPEQTFRGFGAELGYRHYSGLGGVRGFYFGPSLLVGRFSAGAADGSTTSYLQVGVAADAGYEALVADRVSLSVGAGLQWTFTDKSIPKQQFPASVYAGSRALPRILFAVGWAF